ncbi:MAG: lamin tail domain-containing protein, partial [Verrucomicrobia bacterium]|nr:lamin tail domain-containing protein [Verrucomicrobiota bacterium]
MSKELLGPHLAAFGSAATERDSLALINGFMSPAFALFSQLATRLFRSLRMPVVLAVIFQLCPDALAQLRITEFQAANSGSYLDADGQASDWIEIYNPSSSNVSLGGWRLTDDARVRDRWSFPSTNLSPKAFLVIFASGKNRRVPGAELHTNFRLSAGGGYLGLIEPDGATVAHHFAPAYPPQEENRSYGLAMTRRSFSLVTLDHPARTFVPKQPEALSPGWHGTDFNDQDWPSGVNGIGFDRSPTNFVNLGDSLLNRTNEDTTSGQLYIYGKPFSASGFVTTFEFFDNDPSQDGPGGGKRALTPLLFSISNDIYRISAIGRPVITTGGGAQVIPFQPVFGRATVIASNHTFGFFSGSLDVQANG